MKDTTVNKTIVVVTVGNELRGDDGAGILFGEIIRESGVFQVIEGGDAPENVTSLICAANPDSIVIVDAMHFGGSPGDVRFVNGENIAAGGVSTHGTLSGLISYCSFTTGVPVYVLGFQPGHLECGTPISQAVHDSVRIMANIFIKSSNEEDFFTAISLSV